MSGDNSMIIISQDGTHIYNFNKVESIEANTYHSIIAKINNNGFVLGHYTSEERATKILYEITDSYKRTFMIITPPMMEDSYWPSVKEDSNVYRMPKEQI